MKIDLALLKTIYLRPQAILILVTVALVTGLTTLRLCHSVRPRYSVAALFEVAELGAKTEADPRESLFSGGGKGSSDLKLDALAFLEFEYLSGNRDANGVTMKEAKDQKSTNLIQIVAEGYTNESIELYLEEALHDLQTRYQNKIEDSVRRGQNQLEFLNKEMLSLETFKIQVETAIKQVGPSPVLGAQLMELTRDLTRLKQEYFAQKGALSPEKIHNFRLTSVRAMGGGAPVFPRSKPSILFALFIALGLTMYAIFLLHLWQNKKHKVAKGSIADGANETSIQVPSTDVVPKAENKVEVYDSELDKAQAQFVANISNELRSPLHNILGMTGILLGSSLESEQTEFTNSIRTSAESLLTLVNDLLAFKSDDLKPNVSDIFPFTVEEILRNVVENLPYVYNKTHKNVTWDIDDDLKSVRLSGPSRQIEQTLTHLITNALKFSREANAHVRVSNVNRGTKSINVRFEVNDTGPGIPHHTLQRLFKAFEQQDMGANRKFGGGGIGLTIAQKLVTAMGGRMGVESVIGLGSKFWFAIPLESAGQIAQPVSVVEPLFTAHHDQPKYRILLAEDNTLTQKITVQILERFGHRVDVASDGNEALDALRLLPYDLILMDCHMPGMDGYEATRLIRTSQTLPQSDIPIIAVTGSIGEFERGRCALAGMNDSITKPFRADDLYSLVDTVMREKRRTA